MHTLKFKFEFSEKELRKECLEKMEQEEKKMKKRKRNIFISIPLIIGLFALSFWMISLPEKPILTLLSAFVICINIMLIANDFMYITFRSIYKTDEYLLEHKQWYSLAGNLHIINIIPYFGKDEAIEEIQENIRKNKNEYDAEIHKEGYNKFLKIKLKNDEFYFYLKNDYPVNLEEFPIVLFLRNGVYLEKEEKTA